MNTYPRIQHEKPYTIEFKFLSEIIEVLDQCDASYFDSIYGQGTEFQQKKLNETFKGNSYKQKTILKRLRTELNDTYQLRAPKQWKETFPENTAFKKADVIRIITEIATSN